MKFSYKPKSNNKHKFILKKLDMKFKLDSIINSFPLIFIIFTSLGYIHLECYYFFFNIEIIHYLEITEIALLFFNKSILIVTIILLILLVLQYYENNRIQKDNLQTSNVNKEINKKQNKSSKYFIWIIIILQTIYIITNLISKDYISLIYTLCFLLSCLLCLVFEKAVLLNMIKIIVAFYTYSLLA